MKDINALFEEVLDLVMSLNTVDDYTKAFLTLSHRRNALVKEYERKKTELELMKGELLNKEKVSDLKLIPILLTIKPEAKTLMEELQDLEEIRKLLQNALDTILLRKDLWVAERKAGI